MSVAISDRAGSDAAGIVIVGAGHAGGALAGYLRQYGWTGPITLLGAEPEPPYQRPPLSKAWLKGETTADTLAVRPLPSYAEANIDLRLDTTVASLDLAAQTLTTESGATLPWSRLVLATGARNRKLPIAGSHLAGLHDLRTMADAERLKAALRPGRRLAVIGAGFIGLEVAATARALGVEVIVVEREARVLARVASPAVSALVAARHRAAGVDLLLAQGVAGFEPTERDAGSTGIGGVRLADGRLIPCDLALVGIGAAADDALARAAGLVCRDGIVVDDRTRTSVPGILAIGDCTQRPVPHFGQTMRLESVPSALEQARIAASALTGKPLPPPEVPWFWSDQYELRLQMAGLSAGAARTVERGDAATGKLAVFHLDGENRLLAVEAVSAGAEFMAGRLLIGRRAVIDPARLADPSVSMKTLAAGA